MRVGWIGAGVMGRWMAGHLLSGGHELAVFSRTASKCAPLVAAGARHATSPADVEEVTLGPTGALSSLPTGGLLVDCTTSTPSLAERVSAAAAARGVLALDAPVSGGDVGAKAATLSIMCGGSDEAFARARPLLELMGGTIKHMGGAGGGQHTKMCNQVR